MYILIPALTCTSTHAEKAYLPTTNGKKGRKLISIPRISISGRRDGMVQRYSGSSVVGVGRERQETTAEGRKKGRKKFLVLVFSRFILGKACKGAYSSLLPYDANLCSELRPLNVKMMGRERRRRRRRKETLENFLRESNRGRRGGERKTGGDNFLEALPPLSLSAKFGTISSAYRVNTWPSCYI